MPKVFLSSHLFIVDAPVVDGWQCRCTFVPADRLGLAERQFRQRYGGIPLVGTHAANKCGAENIEGKPLGIEQARHVQRQRPVAAACLARSRRVLVGPGGQCPSWKHLGDCP